VIGSVSVPNSVLYVESKALFCEFCRVVIGLLGICLHMSV